MAGWCARGETVLGLRPARARHHRSPVRRPYADHRLPASRRDQLRGLDRRRRRRGARGDGARGQRARRREPGRRLRAARARRWRRSPRTTCSPGRPAAVRRGRPDRAAAPRTAAPSWPGSEPCSACCPTTGYVIRTAWLYGRGGPNFVRTMIKLAGGKQTVDVVADQRGQPTWTADVADQVITLAAAGARGIYHATSAGQTTWFELARCVFGCSAPTRRGCARRPARPTRGRRRAPPTACSATTATRPAGRADRRLAAGPSPSLADAVGVLRKGQAS